MVCHSRLSRRDRKPAPVGWAAVSLVFMMASVALPAPAAAQAPGTISTVAGTGVWGSSGDGGPATAARIQEIYGIAVDKDGSLYLTGLASNTVRKVTASDGLISRVAGTGEGWGSTGDGELATAARLGGPIHLAVDADYNLYISEYLYFKIRKVSGASGIIETAVGTGTRTTMATTSSRRSLRFGTRGASLRAQTGTSTSWMAACGFGRSQPRRA